MKHIRGIAALVIAATGVAVAYEAGPVLACGLDGIPSLLANGQRVRINTAVPTTAAQLAVFSPFIVAHTYSIGQLITLTEDRAEVAKSLNAQSMRRPWRWHFGDGTVAYGWTVKHAYEHAGQQQVLVDAYYPGTGKWYKFDAVTLMVGGVMHH